MSDIIDTSVFCGYWPFRSLPYRTPEALKTHLLSHGVRQAWVASAEAILYPDPMQGNEPLFEAIAGDSFFTPVAIIDVTLATWRADVQICLEQWDCRALKLAPNYHQYELGDARVAELISLAGEAGLPVCVQMRMMDERSHHPLMKVPGVPIADIVALARHHPEARFLVCGAYQAELKMLGKTANIWAEISFVEAGQALASAVAALGAERLVFGSHSPFFYFEAVAAKLDVDPVDVLPDQVKAIREENTFMLLDSQAR